MKTLVAVMTMLFLVVGMLGIIIFLLVNPPIHHPLRPLLHKEEGVVEKWVAFNTDMDPDTQELAWLYLKGAKWMNLQINPSVSPTNKELAKIFLHIFSESRMALEDLCIRSEYISSEEKFSATKDILEVAQKISPFKIYNIIIKNKSRI